ncbi:hypothetical protein QFZ34_001043 [Phyllobacterium ifriqiyense]|uniref:DUF982 domain-containing protein n=1 Tax=Phyllobacterium ifriqiyense TaxID=314238 RepID=A0ABU0S535_9HYPH|nr:hypothetical protein [Phyllobacterium ifriqiyense]MDQ0995866.1 hypothetical protein [Phyllobacterium ifriqiyense]
MERFIRRDDAQYSAEDWSCMELALRMACQALSRDPKNGEHSGRAARMVLTLWEQGLRDAEEIALRVVNRELELIELARAEYQRK